MGGIRKNVQVNIVRLQLLQARPQRRGDVTDAPVDLGREEDLLAGHAGLLQRRADLRLGLVDLRGVLVVVAQAESQLCGVDACLVDLGLVAGLVPGCPGAVAQLGLCQRATSLKEVYWLGGLPWGCCCHR